MLVFCFWFRSVTFAFLSRLLYARLRAVASYEVLLRKAGASSLMLRDVHFRRPHNILKTGERNIKRYGLSCAVAQEKRENLKSSRERNYDHAGDVAIVDKSYRRNSCLISSSHDRDAERADRTGKINRLDKFAMDKWKKHQETFPLRGHCWRAALLAVFRLIVVGFVREWARPGRCASWPPRACTTVVNLASRTTIAGSYLSAQRAYVANAWISR